MQTKKTSLAKKKKIFSFIIICTCLSGVFAWTFLTWYTSVDYDYEYGGSSSSGGGPAVDVLLAAPTLVQLADDDNLETNFSVWDRSSQCPMSFSYSLWSRYPSTEDWSDIEDMCNVILNRTHPLYEYYAEEGRNRTVPNAHNEYSMANLLSNCSQFFRLAPFHAEPESEEEAQYPLAYVFVGARNAAQTVRLFRMLYQPQNAYCITYDNKSSEIHKTVLARMVDCFGDHNVFLSPELEPIYYTDYSILHSVMVCMKELLDRQKRGEIPSWRYVQVVSWNDMPLRTNREMVRIFKILNGSQDCALERLTEEFFVFEHNLKGDIIPSVYRTVVPDGLTMYKGSYATSMTREFVQFLFENPTSQRLYEWLQGGKCAEEQYWTTIAHNVHLNAPGAFPGQCVHFYTMRGKKKPFLSRYQIWTWTRERCYGKITNFSCVYGVKDLANLIERPELIAHKLYEEYQPVAPFCLEYWFWRRRCTKNVDLPEEYYADLPSVRYHNLKNKNHFIC